MTTYPKKKLKEKKKKVDRLKRNSDTTKQESLESYTQEFHPEKESRSREQ